MKPNAARRALTALRRLEALSLRGTWLCRAPVWVKLAVVTTVILVAAAIPSAAPDHMAVVLLPAVLWLLLARPPLRLWLGWTAILTPAALLCGIGGLLGANAEVVLFGQTLPRVVAVTIGLILRGWICGWMVLGFTSTTCFARFGKTSFLWTFYRSLFLLLEEASNHVNAHALRAPAPLKLAEMGAFAGGLLLRTHDRAVRVENAAKVR